MVGIQIFNVFSESFGWSFVYFHAFNSGYSISQICLFWMTIPFTVLIGILILGIKPVDPNLTMIIAFFLKSLAILIITNLNVFTNNLNLLQLSAICYGGFAVLFWVIFNSLYMNLTSKENRAEKSSILFALLAITGTIFPIIAGFGIKLFGRKIVYMIAASTFFPYSFINYV
jgi:hypothetical protein